MARDETIMTIKPMLATAIEDMTEEGLSKLRYPLLASIKYDGVRAVMQDGKLVSRSLKSIPNQDIQQMFKRLPEGFDGELMFGNPAAKKVFSLTTSVVMSRTKQAAGVKFYAFDQFGDGPFKQRSDSVYEQVFFLDDENVIAVNQKMINSVTELLKFEQVVLEAGYEGLILRSIDGPYKQGRATERQGWMLKLKRFVDAEAVIVGSYEEQENTNVAITNQLGRSERSSAKAGMVGKGTLGGFEVKGLGGEFDGVEFQVGGGFDAEDREQFWKQRKQLIGKIIKYKYFPIGTKDKPRFPVFLGFRDKEDM